MNKSLHRKEPESREERETKRPFVLASVIIAMFMAAIEGTIVSTAMPGIVGDLGGFALYSWVFSAYLLMQAVTILIYGKLSDLYGRKPVFTIGIIIFLAGSVMCGLAGSMKQLIIYRLIQGLGAGAVQPIATTIVGDMYTIEERAKIQGYLASVWGISAIVGPLLGGFFVTYSHWSLVFWMNIPLGILAMAGVGKFLHENVERKKVHIDYLGSLLVLIGVSALMVLLIQGGTAWPWNSWESYLLGIGSVLILFGFFKHESRFPEPLMPISLWNNRLISLSNAASLTNGAVLIGLSSFLPTYIQGVMEQPPVVAGFTLTAMSVGWPICSTIAGKLLLKIGFRPVAIAGGVALFLGSLVFIFMDPAKGPVWAGAGSFLIGCGMGLTNTTYIVAIQNTVDWKTRGIATASNMFMRIVGSALGAAVLGGILNTRLSTYFDRHGNENEKVTLDAANILLDEEKRSKLSSSVLELLQNGLSFSLADVYKGVLILSILSLLFSIMLPKAENPKTKSR
ncbi:drug resistance transporter, EmrB/QacA subfamily [Fictibacillus solisalsi]|uniref:Drug resistance transporter, EmrB/QacA subfamily n=1 Tax=Fictibacillus solisalsi TaxID=459525 RepID=A0A1G9UNP4_9BACL|nr:MDR family MFS transporter [Fictibacillus solisalsi]SDM61539.1 drug resistance transporter, EmrB/QacA subfamily [Fictibacillus solisalsi]